MTDTFWYDGEDIPDGSPQWFKLWAIKYADALDIDHLDDDLDPEEKHELFTNVGKAFINAIFYFKHRSLGANDLYYTINSRDGRIIWNALKRDIDQSYLDYLKRVENGAKGGRPKAGEKTNG